MFFKLNFQDEGQFYANGLFDIPNICGNFLLFQFLSRIICMHIPILLGV